MLNWNPSALKGVTVATPLLGKGSLAPARVCGNVAGPPALGANEMGPTVTNVPFGVKSKCQVTKA